MLCAFLADSYSRPILQEKKSLPLPYLNDFAATLLAICFFRLPAMQAPIIDAATPNFNLQALYKRSSNPADTEGNLFKLKER